MVINPDRFVKRFPRRHRLATRWEKRGTYTLQVRMCFGCLHGEHSGCDHKRPCSCICRRDLGERLEELQLKVRLTDI